MEILYTHHHYHHHHHHSSHTSHSLFTSVDQINDEYLVSGAFIHECCQVCSFTLAYPPTDLVNSELLPKYSVFIRRSEIFCQENLKLVLECNRKVDN